MTYKHLLRILIVFALSLVSMAQCERKSLLSVKGIGELRVVPDQVNFSIQVQNFDRDRLKARSDNATRVRSVLGVLRSFKVDERDLQTSQQSIDARYKGGDESKTLLGFNAVTHLSVKLRDIREFDEIQEKVLASGATEVSHIRFESSDLQKQRAKARAMAIAAAKEKASAMAQELGQNIGRAFSISEAHDEPWFYTAANTTSVVVTEQESSVAEGTIPVREEVTIEFELQ
jgi:hypothetical protein